MTVQTSTSTASFAGNGVTSVFPIGFKFNSAADLVVSLIEDATGGILPLTLNSQYTVSGAGDDSGGAITMISPPAAGQTLSVRRVIGILQPTDLRNQGSFFAEVHEDAFDRLTMIAQQQQGAIGRAILVPETDPVPSTLPSAPGRASRVLGFDAEGNPVAVIPVSGSATDLALSLVNPLDPSKGSGQIGHRSALADSVASTVRGKLDSLAPNAVVDFGADNTGATDATDALLAFFTGGIASGLGGHIPAGTYLVRGGVLAFDNGFVASEWPDFTTDGYAAVTFKRADATAAPLLSISNGEASSGSGQYWRGGSLGGITFDQNGLAQDFAHHGLALRGIWGARFGYMRGLGLGGSTVTVPLKLYSTTNPDPYAVTACVLEGIEGVGNGSYALENRNYLGFNACQIGVIRAISCSAGAWLGAGTGNEVSFMSCGSCGGWAIDDGTHADALGGAPLRNFVLAAEFDNMQNGLRLNRSTSCDFGEIRFVHRYNTAPNAGGNYWPRTAILIAGGTSPSVRGIRARVTHRIEAGGTKAGVGVLVNLSGSAQISDVDIEQYVVDNAGFGFSQADYFTGANVLAGARLTSRGLPLLDSVAKPAVCTRASASLSIPNSGWGAIGSKLTYASPVYDKSEGFDTGSSWFTVPYTGLYRVSGSFALTVAAGTRVRIGFATTTDGSTVTVQLAKTTYQATSGVEHHSIDGLAYLSAGARLFLIGDQNTAGAVTASVPNSVAADLQWSAVAL